jgi:hypothetical protein
MNQANSHLLTSRMFSKAVSIVRRGLSTSRRSYASVSSGLNPNSVGPFQVFDRTAKTLQKDRSATFENGERSRTVDYVREEVADRMIERLLVRISLDPRGTR